MIEPFGVATALPNALPVPVFGGKGDRQAVIDENANPRKQACFGLRVTL